MSRSPDIALYPEEIKDRYPSEHLWDFLAYWSVRPLVDLTQVEFTSQGQEHFERAATSRANVFVMSNHISWADHFLIIYYLIRNKPWRCSPIAKEKYYSWHGAKEILRMSGTIPITNIKITFARWFHGKHGRVPTEQEFVEFMEHYGRDQGHEVNQRKAAALGRTVENVRTMLERGRVVLAYPEGTRSKDGRLQATKTGMMQLPLMFKGTIVPTAVIGTNKILGRDSHWFDFVKYFFWKGPQIQCIFGPPLRWDAALDEIEAKFQRREDPVDLARVRDLRREIAEGTFYAFSAQAQRYERIFDEVALMVMRRINDLLPEEYRAPESVEVKYSRAI